MTRPGFTARLPRIGLLLPAAAAGIALFCSGCDDRLPIAPVSGRVLLDGEPLANATVTFQPRMEGDKRSSAAPGSVGRTDADGRYELRLIAPDLPGALVGKHSVRITTATATTDDSKLPTGERVPLAWRNGSRTFVVPATGSNAADFVIE